MVKFGIIVFFINELMVVVVVSVSVEVIGLFPRNVYEVSRLKRAEKRIKNGIW